jgi:hypothetical protein
MAVMVSGRGVGNAPLQLQSPWPRNRTQARGTVQQARYFHARLKSKLKDVVNQQYVALPFVAAAWPLAVAHLESGNRGLYSSGRTASPQNLEHAGGLHFGGVQLRFLAVPPRRYRPG